MLQLMLLDTEFKLVAVLDGPQAVIWTDRFQTSGEMELTFPVDQNWLTVVESDFYVISNMSEHVMVVSSRQSDRSQLEYGSRYIIKGNSLEQMLDRRIIERDVTISGSLQSSIEAILNDNFISPVDPNRSVGNLVFVSNTDADITTITDERVIEAGTNVYDFICKVCYEYGIGFQMTLNDTNEFEFKLYSGIDRTYNQTAVPYVVFSKEFDNITYSSYYTGSKFYKNTSYVMNSDATLPNFYIQLQDNPFSGWDRRELATDGRYISRTPTDGGADYSDEELAILLATSGIEDLFLNTKDQAFDGEMDISKTFKFGEDFFMGDIVQIVDESNREGYGRIVEMLFTLSDQGFQMYPTFDIL